MILIDGDVLAHMAVSIDWHREPNHDFGITDEEAEIYDSVVSLYGEPVQLTRKEAEIIFRKSWHGFLYLLEKVVEDLYGDDYLMAMKSKINFRSELFPEYKAHRRRKPSMMSPFVPQIMKRAVVEGLAVEAVGRESDDMLRIWANEVRAAGGNYVVASIDKDLRCIPGRHYNVKSGIIEVVDEPTAKRFFFEQIMSGDAADGIPGIPGIGPIKARKALDAVDQTEEAFQELVVGLYINAFGDEAWYNTLLINAKLIHIQNHVDDWFEISKWPVVRSLLEI